MKKLDRGRTAAAMAGACIACAAMTAAATADTPPSPSHEITVLQTRDAVLARGYAEGLPAVVSVLRYNAATSAFDVVSRSQPVLPQDDPATPDVFDGIVSVNRADGGCWRRLTPDIRPGDRVRVIQRDESGELVANDSTITGSVNASAATVVFDAERRRYFAEVHGSSPRITLGTGQPVAGARVPLSQLEVRIVNDDGFATNGRTALVSRIDGTLRYDSPDAGDPRWTARFAVRPIDVAEVEAAVTRAMWLGRDPEAGTELTVAEDRAGGVKGGPRAGCTAPAEGTTDAEATAPEQTLDLEPSAPELEPALELGAE